MPERSKRRRRAQREVDEATRHLKRCSYCPGLYSLYKSAWKIHEARCKSRPQSTGAGSGAPMATDTTHRSRHTLDPNLMVDLDDDSEGSESDFYPAATHSAGFWDNFGTDTFPREIPVDAAAEPSQPDEELQDTNGIPPLQPGQVWVKRHPMSKQPSGFLAVESHLDQSQNPGLSLEDNLLLYRPFRSMDDFLQAEIFSDFGDTDKKIDCQLKLTSTNVSLKNAKDYHATLALAVRLWGGEFTSQSFITKFEGQDFKHYVHFQPIFPALKKVESDPDLAQYMVYYPEERWVHRPDTNDASMQVWEEPWHGKLWWTLQSRIQPNQCILYIIIYIDETSVSTIGGVSVWPIYAWVGNLPASIQKRRTKKGGTILIGYLPKAHKGTKVKDLAGFRCQVYHDALSIVFESLQIPSRYGAPVRCGDGIVRQLVPVIAAGSADYMEIIKMICILGHRSGFPCPICLVPRHEQSKLTKSWPIRTVYETETILNRAKNADSTSERDAILKEQSLRSVRSVFLDIIPSIHSIYSAVIADPLHQIEQGIWGKHLWPWIRDQLPTASQEILDARMQSIPQYPDLKHFPNGITGLKYITGKEHGVILRTIGPLLEDLLLDKYKALVIGTFRTLATIHVLAKFTTHNDISLEELDKQIRKFDKLHAKLAKKFDELTANYPKFHSLSHLVDIIRRHSTTDNYHTGLGEALHPQSKKDYRRTNHQKDFEIQMLRMHQEREAIIRIRARIDSAKSHDRKGEDLDSALSWDGPSVQLGAPDRNGRQAADSFIQNRVQTDPRAREMARYLRTFLYQQVGGYGDRVHFSMVDLPLLDGMLVMIYRLITVGYTSDLDSRLGLDVVRVTDSWRNQGPRHDYVLVVTERETFVAQLLQVFALKARGEQHSIAYVRCFKIKGRSKITGYIELIDTKTQNFIFTSSIVRSCVVISPGIQDSTYVLWDLESSDMYLRLKNL